MELTFVKQFAVPADRLWEYFGFFNAKPLPLAECEDVIYEGSGMGALRIFRFKDKPAVIERLVELDEVERYRAIRLIDAGFLPFSDYYAGLRVTAHGPNASSIVVRSWSVPVGIGEAEARQIETDVAQMMFALAARALG